MKAKIRLMGLLCHLKKLLNKPKILIQAILIIYLSGLYIGVNAQQTPYYEPLKIGEKVPDIEFAIKNYHSPTAKISDFKGKLLILDFWTTYCTTCIYSFPKMQKLQKEYGDKIQIILVNVRETQEEIDAKLKNRDGPISLLNEMPSIIGSEALDQLFPHQFAGNYFWIDTKGDLCLSSAIFYNHNDQKITDVLNGKPITFVKHDRDYQKDKLSLSEIIFESPVKHAEFSSLFTTVDLNYYPVGGQILERIDNKGNTMRNTFINRSVLELFDHVLEDLLDDEWESKVFGPNLGTNKYLDHFLMHVGDSSLYDNRFIPHKLETDINMVKALFCYEQVIPVNFSKEQASQLMLEDLNRYFGLKYGATVNVEEVIIPCYLINRINDKQADEKEIRMKLRHLGNREFETISSFLGFIDRYYRPGGANNNDEYPYVFDVDGLNKKIKITVPVWKEGDNLKDFQLALRLNGLEYQKGMRKIKMIVVRDNQ